MNHEVLVEAMDTIDDKYLLFATEYKVKFRFRGSSLARAACICLCLISLVYLINKAPRPALSKGGAEQPAEQQIQYSAQIEALTLEDLVERSSLIVSARVTEKSSPIRIHPANGMPDRLYIDWTLEPEAVHRGEPASGNTITLRTYAGEVDSQASCSEPILDFHIGESILVFLSRPDSGGFYQTYGDYYLITGCPQGIFYYEDGGLKLTQALTDDQHATDALIREIEEISERYPIILDWNYRYNVEHTAMQLKNGVITQKEYDHFWEDYTRYATIIS